MSSDGTALDGVLDQDGHSTSFVVARSWTVVGLEAVDLADVVEFFVVEFDFVERDDVRLECDDEVEQRADFVPQAVAIPMDDSDS